MNPKRVLVITPDRVGPQHAGIALRHIGIARALARRGFEVTLASTDPHSVGLEDCFRFTTVDSSSAQALVEGCDACLVQGNVLDSLPILAEQDTPLIVDLICPVFLENLERYRGRDDIHARVESDLSMCLKTLRSGDYFICGSPRQRYFWLGMLAALGRVDPVASRDDPSLGRLISVVPFGVPEEPPLKRKPVLKGVVAGVDPDDVVLLWAGGLWNWLDPLTPIRAVAEVSRELPHVKLLFIGLRHPQDERPSTEMGERAVALAEELGLKDRNVFFVDGWVGAEEIGDYLLEADVALSAHPATIEMTFSVRTRFWTYLWAGLPVIASEGDWVADTIRTDGLGISVAIGDVHDFAEAIRQLADPKRRRDCAAAARSKAATMTWDRAVAPLADLLDSDSDAQGAPRKLEASATIARLPVAQRRAPRVAGGAPAHRATPSVTARSSPRPRVAMVGQPEYFRCLYENDLDHVFEIFEYELQWGRDWTAYKPVLRFDPDVAIFFRPEMYPHEFLDTLKCRKVALSSEPIPKYVDGGLVSSDDMMYRFESLCGARGRYDRFYHYDRTSIPFLEENGFGEVREFVFPVATGTYRPLPLEKTWDACFFGRDTPYRERHLGTLKRDFDVLHVAHGVIGKDWVHFANRSRIGINLHVDERPSLEHRMQNMMACGIMVMGDRLSHNDLLRAGEHYVGFDGPDDFRQKFEHYLVHEDEREEISRRGRERVLERLDGARNLEALITEILLAGR